MRGPWALSEELLGWDSAHSWRGIASVSEGEGLMKRHKNEASKGVLDVN